MAEPNSTPSRGSKGHSKPITRHPVFPAIVALWFCALLGLGSLTVSAPALEGLVLATHIDAIVPAAAPPLGMTARLIVALALAVVGGGIGWLLALRVAGPDAVPEPHVFKFSDLDDNLPWPGMADPAATADEPAVPAELAFDPVALPDPEPEIAAAPEPKPAPAMAAERIVSADLETLSQVELVERLAIALQRRQDRQAAATLPAPASDPVIRFPGLADRQGARVNPTPSALRPEAHETEKALHDALARLQRISGAA